MSVSVLDITVGEGRCEGIHPDDGKDCLEPLCHCEGCGSTHPSEEECPVSKAPIHECHVCETRVMWVKNPDSFRDKLKRAPADKLGKEMLEIMGIHYFQTAAQLRQWQEFIEVIPESQIRRTWNECGKSTRKHGWLKYTLNKLNWLIDHGKVERMPVVVKFDPDAVYVP